MPLTDPSPDTLAASLRATVSALVRATRTTDRLSPIPAAVLDLLEQHGPMTTAELATSRGVRHQTMAATVKELTDIGYLTASPDPADARKKLLSLTAKGSSAVETDRRRRVAVLAKALAAQLDEHERNLLAQALPLLDRMAASISAEPRGPITGAW
jgi:DNA-binding MarR family transcriptional regulator